MILSQLVAPLIECGIKGKKDVDIAGISFDSRKVKPGQLFVCLSGTVQDGHLFVHDAARNGAVAILAEHEVVVPNAISVVIVPDARAALAIIAAHYYDYPSKKLKLIGVTGTNGKTTTVHLLNQMLNDYGKSSGLIGTLGMSIADYYEKTVNTTPESLEIQRLLHVMVENKAEYAVMEVSSHALKMGRVNGCTFETGIFTNLTHDHLDYHGSFEEYRNAKKLMFSEFLSQNDPNHCTAVLNADDPCFKVYAKATKAEVLKYGLSIDADIRAENIQMNSNGSFFTLYIHGKRRPVHLKTPGIHNVYNGLASIATGFVHQIPIESMIETLARFTGVDGRFEILRSTDGVMVVVDYAHNPDGLRQLLSSVRQLVKGRVYCVFGCEGDRDRLKRPVMARIALELSDLPVLTLDNTRMEDPEAILKDMASEYERNNVSRSRYYKVPDRRKAIWFALELAQPGDCVVIAGKGHETVQILGRKEVQLNDKQVVLDFWQQNSLLTRQG